MIASVVLVVVVVAGAVDPGAARAVASKNLRLLDEADAALAAGDAAVALERTLSVDESDRRLDRRRFLLVRGRSRLALSLLSEGADDLDAAAALVPLARTDLRQLAAARRELGHFDRCADVLLPVLQPGGDDDDDAVLAAGCLRATVIRRASAHDVLGERTSTPARLLRARVRLEDGLVRLARADVIAVVEGDGGLDDAGLKDLEDAFAAAGDARFAAHLQALRRARAGRAPVPPPARARLLLDDKERLRDRLRALVDQARWEELRALHPRVRAAAYLDDDDVRYAVAWALVVTGDLDGADRVLDGVRGQGAFERATALRAVIATCRRDGGDACPR